MLNSGTEIHEPGTASPCSSQLKKVTGKRLKTRSVFIFPHLAW